MINRAVSYQEFKAEEVCRLWDFELLLPVSHCGQYLNMEFVEQVSDLSGSDYDDEEEDLSLQPPLPRELTGKKWQEQILINKNLRPLKLCSTSINFHELVDDEDQELDRVRQ